MNKKPSVGLVTKTTVASAALVALVGMLSGCAPMTSPAAQPTSTQDRQAAVDPDHPTVCYTNNGQSPIEIEWNAGKSGSQVHKLNVTERWCDTNEYQLYGDASRAGITWEGDPQQLIVESGNDSQGLWTRYLDTSSGKDEWITMPLTGDFDGKGVTDIGDHRIVTDTWKVGTKKKFIGVWVQD